MKNRTDTTQFFFTADGRLTLLMHGSNHRRYLRGDHMVFSETKYPTLESEIYKTDDAGSVLGLETQRVNISYSPHGHSQASRLGTEHLGFNGEHHQTLIESYLLGGGYHRPYNPTLMRFYRPDSLSPFEAGGLNMYGYCSGDPVNKIDPTGHVSFSKILTRIPQFFSRKERLRNLRNRKVDKYWDDVKARVIASNKLNLPTQVELNNITDKNIFSRMKAHIDQHLEATPPVRRVSQNTLNYSKRFVTSKLGPELETYEYYLEKAEKKIKEAKAISTHLAVNLMYMDGASTSRRQPYSYDHYSKVYNVRQN